MAAVARAWGSLGLGELAVPKMGFANELSASGFALIIGYFWAAYRRNKHAAPFEEGSQ